jgi:hypothetical protein
MTEHKIQCLLHCTALVLSRIPKYKTKYVSHTAITESCSSRPVQDPGFTPDGVSPNRNFDCSRRWSNTECWCVAARLPSNPYRERRGRRGTFSGATLMYTKFPLRTVQHITLFHTAGGLHTYHWVVKSERSSFYLVVNCTPQAVQTNKHCLLWESHDTRTGWCTYIVLTQTYCTILYLLCSLLHVSFLNLGHPQGATSFFDVYSAFSNLYKRNWHITYINVGLLLNYNVKYLELINNTILKLT